MGAVDGDSYAAARQIASRARAARDVVADACGAMPSRVRSWVRTAVDASGSPLNRPGLAAVTRAFAKWAGSVGKGSTAAKLVSARRDCSQLQRSLSASYRVWWRWTDDGRAWWVDVTVVNDSHQRIGINLYGTIRATGLQSGEARKPHALLRWGGSADDEISVDRHTVLRTAVVVGADRDIHTTADGSVRVARAEVVAYLPGRRPWWCAPPAPAGS
jgi:hypothetical protein